MTRLTAILITIVFLVATGQAAEPVLSIDTDRIILLAQQAIADQDGYLDSDNMKFSQITYTYRSDGKAKNDLAVSFIHSPDAKKTIDEEKETIKTRTKWKVVTVKMEKTGKIVLVSEGGMHSTFKIESIKKETVEES